MIGKRGVNTRGGPEPEEEPGLGLLEPIGMLSALKYGTVRVQGAARKVGRGIVIAAPGEVSPARAWRAASARQAARPAGALLPHPGPWVPAGRGQRWAAAAGRALPEHIEMPMPRLVPTMTYGVISKWLVSEGDYVEVADLVCEIDVQNLTSELPAATCFS